MASAEGAPGTTTVAREWELKPGAADGVSCVAFCPGTEELLVSSSWDACVRLHDVVRNELKAKYQHRAPALTCCFVDRAHIASGGTDRVVKLFDANTGAESVVGTHDAAVRCLESLPMTRGREALLVSGSWDSTCNFWDARAPRCVASAKLPGKVFSMSAAEDRVVAALSGRAVVIFDVAHSLTVPEQQRESSLKYQTRSVRCFPDGTGYALGSVEGRVAIEFFDVEPSVQARKYAFKCHRTRSADGTDTVYPVNAIAFHGGYGTLATGGCDGNVFLWDAINRKRLAQLRKFPTSIASLAFSSTGKMLAIASSYTFEEGEKPDTPPDQIFIREMADAEVKPRPRT